MAFLLFPIITFCVLYYYRSTRPGGDFWKGRDKGKDVLWSFILTIVITVAAWLLLVLLYRFGIFLWWSPFFW